MAGKYFDCLFINESRYKLYSKLYTSNKSFSSLAGLTYMYVRIRHLGSVSHLFIVVELICYTYSNHCTSGGAAGLYM